MKALDTLFDGHKFRSRLEARWAVFFKTLGIAYEYEPQGFDLGAAGGYLPDFWLTDYGYWIEIKGREPTTQEREKCRQLSAFIGRPVVLFIGDPVAQRGETFISDLSNSGGGSSDGYAAVWFVCPECDRPDIALADERPDREVVGGDWAAINCCWNKHLATRTAKASILECARSPRFQHERIERAARLARQARFEHGQTPVVTPIAVEPSPSVADQELALFQRHFTWSLRRPWDACAPMEILVDCAIIGVRLTDLGTVIQIDGPPGLLSEERKAVVRRRREELQPILRRYGGEWPNEAASQVYRQYEPLRQQHRHQGAGA